MRFMRINFYFYLRLLIWNDSKKNNLVDIVWNLKLWNQGIYFQKKEREAEKSKNGFEPIKCIRLKKWKENLGLSSGGLKRAKVWVKL